MTCHESSPCVSHNSACTRRRVESSCAAGDASRSLGGSIDEHESGTRQELEHGTQHVPRTDGLTELHSVLPVPRPALQMSQRDDNDLVRAHAVQQLASETTALGLVPANRLGEFDGRLRSGPD